MTGSQVGQRAVRQARGSQADKGSIHGKGRKGRWKSNLSRCQQARKHCQQSDEVSGVAAHARLLRVPVTPRPQCTLAALRSYAQDTFVVVIAAKCRQQRGKSQARKRIKRSQNAAEQNAAEQNAAKKSTTNPSHRSKRRTQRRKQAPERIAQKKHARKTKTNTKENHHT